MKMIITLVQGTAFHGCHSVTEIEQKVHIYLQAEREAQPLACTVKISCPRCGHRARGVEDKKKKSTDVIYI